MTATVFYWLGAAISITGGLAVLAVLFWLVGGLLLLAAPRMLRIGLYVIRLQNWRYWNARMEKEGLIVMPTFYREQVAKRKPRTMKDFNDLDRAADAHEQAQRSKEANHD